MEIVVEYVLIDNLVVNYLILYTTAFALKINFKKYRLFFSVLFGTALAFVFPILNLNAVLLVVFSRL